MFNGLDYLMRIMKAITCAHFGGTEVLQMTDSAIPKPSSNQLLVKVYASALNRADILQREGKYPPPPGESEIMGLEIAGEIVSCGQSVDDLKVGQRVFGLVAGGGYAQYCLLDQQMAMVMPDHWSYIEAAAVPEVFLTANETICEIGQLKSGETVLIHAGGSGVGTAAIQMAREIGAQIYTTAGSDDKIKKACNLGAHAGINYKQSDFVQEILRLTDGKGVDLIEDFIGADYFAKHLTLLKEQGRLIQVAVMSGRLTEIDLSVLMAKRLHLIGFIMRRQSIENKREITQRFKSRWLNLMINGKINPIIDTVFKLDHIQAAHRYMEESKQFGKIVLEID